MHSSTYNLLLVLNNTLWMLKYFAKRAHGKKNGSAVNAVEAVNRVYGSPLTAIDPRIARSFEIFEVSSRLTQFCPPNQLSQRRC